MQELSRSCAAKFGITEIIERCIFTNVKRDQAYTRSRFCSFDRLWFLIHNTRLDFQLPGRLCDRDAVVTVPNEEFISNLD